jgi:hypothetical protein
MMDQPGPGAYPRLRACGASRAPERAQRWGTGPLRRFKAGGARRFRPTISVGPGENRKANCTVSSGHGRSKVERWSLLPPTAQRRRR